MNYSNVLEIIFDRQEKQCGTEASGNGFISHIQEGPELEAAIARLDDQFNDYAKRFGRNWK